ncbi:MAG: hypothetical protein KKA73_18360 [Chloroflexi bacterium]|nr:hypothetical protein [Chloroflexota bacterium]MBU1749651.1 hypothetical protein [Chloroflexota bacterium]
MADNQYVKALDYMRSILDEHRDPHTGRVNMTHLAADACQHLNLWERDGTEVPEWLFELAFDLTEEE